MVMKRSNAAILLQHQWNPFICGIFLILHYVVTQARTDALVYSSCATVAQGISSAIGHLEKTQLYDIHVTQDKPTVFRFLVDLVWAHKTYSDEAMKQ